MKKIILTMFLIFLSINCFAEDSRILNIRKEYTSIHKTLSSMKRYDIEVNDKSSEGGLATAYADKKGNIVFVKEGIYGEGGKVITEYYFKNSKLFFVFVKDFTYNAPSYLDKDQAKQMGVEPFDMNKTKITENRFYFNKDKLIRWIDNSKKVHTTANKAGSVLKAAYSLRREVIKTIKKGYN